MEEDVVDRSVGFLFRAMVERDPQKRRVKPVEKHMLQLNFGGLDDSSDDSDYNIGEHEQESDISGDSENISSSNSDSEEDDNEENDNTANLPTKKKESSLSLGDLIEAAKNKQAQARNRIAADGIISTKIKILICSVCLGDIRDLMMLQKTPRHSFEEDDEIVECDNCGVSVHEGCYGISESESVASTVSSSSTEPWFCDACKAGVKPLCELCPNLGGIFKETDAGKWVHLVCALYIPGVAFGDVDKLTPVTLFEMPYAKWGAKECCLCEDERFSQTGVCISCDAGMCRNYFHVSCAQREGLLSEALQEEDIADPFFAYCKLHADKAMIQKKKRNWLAVQSQIRQHASRQDLSDKDKARIQRKLEGHQKKYEEAKALRPPPWTPTQKLPRLLTTSPSACRRLMKKAQLLGINTQTLQVQHSVTEKLIDIRRKWHVPPAFSIEFVSYYLDRNERMIQMQSHLDDLLTQNDKLQEEERSLREKYDELSNNYEKLKTVSSDLRERGEKLWKILIDIAGKKLLIPELLNPKKVTRCLKQDRKRDSSVIHQCGICKNSHDQHQLAKCDTCHLSYHLGCLDPPLTRMPKKTKLQGWQCSECDKTDKDEVETNKVNPDAPRKLRLHIKEPIKFTQDTEKYLKRKGLKLRPGSSCVKRRKPDDSDEDNESQSSVEIEEIPPPAPPPPPLPPPIISPSIVIPKNQENLLKMTAKVKLKPLVEKKDEKKDKSTSSSPAPAHAKVKECLCCFMGKRVREPRVVPQARKPNRIDVRSLCNKCNTPGNNGNLVRCDECEKCFHFMCLDPPVKKSPKQPGYTWHCEECDPTEPEDGEDMEVDGEVMEVDADTKTKHSNQIDGKKSITKSEVKITVIKQEDKKPLPIKQEDKKSPTKVENKKSSPRREQRKSPVRWKEKNLANKIDRSPSRAEIRKTCNSVDKKFSPKDEKKMTLRAEDKR